MNLLEAIKQIAEHTDDKQTYMPRERNFPHGLLNEMYRQTANAQTGIGRHGRDIRLNAENVARFVREQAPSENIEDRRGQPPPPDEPYSVSVPDDLAFDPNDPLAQLLGINSIGAMTGPIPLPRPRR